MAPPLYNLAGFDKVVQVEPESSYWLRCPILKTTDLHTLRNTIDGAVVPFDQYHEEVEFPKLKQYYDDRLKPVPNLSRLLSDDIFFERPPFGAVLSENSKGIENGVELATLFEAETPGLWHRQILNVLLDPAVEMGLGRMLSPPRQALLWAALDVAIASALSAAWHYKWIAEGLNDVKYRRRPIEYVNEHNENNKEHIEFTPLYDLAIEFSAGKIVRTNPKPPGLALTPGTPRHPAYPSGHSTYSAAASHVLGFLLKDFQDPRAALQGINWQNEFMLLAENIGVARFYGGVHWESDHVFGQQLGMAVGDDILDQLSRSGIPLEAQGDLPVPNPAKLLSEARAFEKACGTSQGDFRQGIVPRRDQIQQNIQVL